MEAEALWGSGGRVQERGGLGLSKHLLPHCT